MDYTNVNAAGQLIGSYTPNGSQVALNFQLRDWLGTLRAVTDSGGTVQEDCESLPYGNGETCATPPNLFTGKERDTESGNDYFGARYYASSMGRMLSPDSGVDQHPENPQSWNLYAYVHNNPLIATDPSGEFTCDSKTVSAQQCENAHVSDEKAGAALDKIKQKNGEHSSQYTDALRAHEALGGRKDNGVVLSIGNAGKDAEGNTTIGPMQAKTEDNPNGQNIKVTLGAGEFDGSEGASTSIEREGSHVADAHDWINTGFNPSASVNFFGSEFRAYNVQANFAEAMDIQIGFHGGEEIFGLGSLAATSETAKGVEIRMILRQSPYHLNPNNKTLLWQDHTKGDH